jgi:hypothetical protein
MKRIIAIVAAVVVAMASANPAHAGPQRRGRYIDVDYPTPEKRAANLAELLSLSDDQKQKVQAIFADQDKQTLALWSDESLAADARTKKIAEVRDAAMKKVRDLLTGEQKKKYDAIGTDENEKEKQPGR